MRRGTYRLQLRPDFGFDQAAALVPYLETLGVSDVYLSPVLHAAAGSTHGYDVVDHSRLSAALGGDAAFMRLVEAARSQALGITVDIVPNHMAIDGRDNRWWWDVLENGPSSLYATYFDIDWPADATHEPTVLVPVLGDRYGKALERREVRVGREGGSFIVRYGDRELPLSPRTQDELLGRAAAACGSAALQEIADGFGRLPHARMTDPAAVRVRHEDKERLREMLALLCEAEPDVASAVDHELERINADPDELDGLLRRQNYRLAYWRSAREELDYRRFFNIETLVGIRVEDEQVFADTHELIGRLVREGRVSGLRVDHVDGLRDPDGYLHRLRRLAPDAYIVVEKILHADERVPAGWPVEGTTGYDFIARVTNAFVDPGSEERLTKCYSNLTGESAVYGEVVRAAKIQIMREELAPEVDRLTRLLHGICENHRRQRDRTRGEVHDALEALLASFPVYRTYAQPDRAGLPSDAGYVKAAVKAAKDGLPDSDPELLDFIGDLLLLQWPGRAETEFAQTFPQVSAPVMAKGAEDTAFYRYNRLVSLNEVGGDPGVFGRALADFHADTAESAERYPNGMLTLATHDTKRGPDVRARIGLLSEMPDEWEAAATSWMGMTDSHAASAGPDYNTRYLFLQTLVGTWPIERERLAAYMDKAAKEAKVYTSWADPDADYDYSLQKFVSGTLDDEAFIAALEAFLREQRVVELGRATSLAQSTLLLTCPGVPDIYQGTETWENSLVDPDNRRPVDFAALASGLGTGPSAGEPTKLRLVSQLLQHRRRRPESYEGGYHELPTTGVAAEHLIAFSRGSLVVLVGRLLHRLGGEWAATSVELPPGKWRPVVSFSAGDEWRGGVRPVADLVGRGPVAVLEHAGS